ncbi:MAG: hypothetical protein QNJ00_11655 [Woeseiaceae bacterium]|nr:hypothetical protein [Woeseiaceae bacterium]
MRRLWSIRALTLLFGVLATAVAGATMVQQMNLGELSLNADKIFRGTVLEIENGTVAAGGGQLDTTTYVIRVSETLKGDTSSPDGKEGNIVRVTMLGSLKQPVTANGLIRASAFTPPRLTTGAEYLLFTTAPSSIGLSTTVGLGQGAFAFIDGENVLNEVKNAGLFRDMDAQGMPATGPIGYDELSGRIRTLVGN